MVGTLDSDDDFMGRYDDEEEEEEESEAVSRKVRKVVSRNLYFISLLRFFSFKLEILSGNVR